VTTNCRGGKGKIRELEQLQARMSQAPTVSSAVLKAYMILRLLFTVVLEKKIC
jgi:hypothetical protein